MFSSSLLTREEWNEATEKERPESDKMRAILHALDKRIATDPKAFHTFLEKVLEQEDAFETLVRKLKGAYSNRLALYCQKVIRPSHYLQPHMLL